MAWTYNEEAGQSGTSAAAFVDPTTNAVLATVPLPVDVGGPVLLPDSIFFAGYQGSTATVVDRATWTVTATPDRRGNPAGRDLARPQGTAPATLGSEGASRRGFAVCSSAVR